MAVVAQAAGTGTASRTFYGEARCERSTARSATGTWTLAKSPRMGGSGPCGHRCDPPGGQAWFGQVKVATEVLEPIAGGEVAVIE